MMLKGLRRFVFENYYKPIGFTKEGKISGFFCKGNFVVGKSEIWYLIVFATNLISKRTGPYKNWRKLRTVFKEQR